MNHLWKLLYNLFLAVLLCIILAPFSLAQNATDVNLRNGTPTGLSVYMDGSFAVKIEPGDRATLTGIEVGRTYIITLRDGNNVSFFKNLTLTTNVCLPLKIPEDFQLFLPLSLEILSVSGGDAGQDLLIEGRIHGGDEGVKELWADINGRMIIIPTNPDMTFQAVIGKEEISDATALSLSAKDGIGSLAHQEIPLRKPPPERTPIGLVPLLVIVFVAAGILGVGFLVWRRRTEKKKPIAP